MGDLAAAGGRYVEARVVDDGDLVTAAGMTSDLDLALWLLERLLGLDAVARVQDALEYERPGPLWRADLASADTGRDILGGTL